MICCVSPKETLLITLKNWKKSFQKLAKSGLKINATKSFFAQTQLEYLGYWITREGIQPISKKVQAILKIKAPKNCKKLRHFIGVLNYYRDMWIRRSHLLTPLTNLTSKNVKFIWTTKEQKAFDLIKRIIARETLLSYPDFSKPFDIHTDVSYY